MAANQIALIRHLAGLRGRSNPFLAGASDGVLYVVKYASLQSELFTLFCECAGSILFGAAGLLVPEWKPLLLTDTFLYSVKNIALRATLKDCLSRSPLVFGSRYLGGQFGRVLEILPSSALGRVKNRESFWLAWLLDVCLRQTDNRQAMFCEMTDQRLLAYFIDHGSLFDDVNYDLDRQIVAARYLDHRIYQGLSSQCLQSAGSLLQSIDVEYVWRLVQDIPEDWLSNGALLRLSECLNRISTREFVNRVSNGIAFIAADVRVSARGVIEEDRKQPTSLLRPGL